MLAVAPAVPPTLFDRLPVADPSGRQHQPGKGFQAEWPRDVRRRDHRTGIHPGMVRGRPTTAWQGGAMLGSSPEPLCAAYDLAMLDLDGVVYVGAEAVPGAADRIAVARAAGMRCAFITNNASRPPAER